MTDLTANLIDRNFSIAEVGVLMAFVMCNWSVADAQECFAELGGHPAAFNRIIASLIADKVIKVHPRKAGYMCLDQVSEALRLRYERAVQAREVVNGSANR